jgi:HD-like signal output (HDOD) protein
MKRILFVDDDPNVLEGLRGLFRKQRREWDMTFATGGEQALQQLASSTYDVIVTDMRMPVVDGAALLQRVVQDWPHLVRIVLSGQTEQEVARRLVYLAHQFISKPAEGRELHKIIEQACTLQTLLGRPALLGAVGKIGQLPVQPDLRARAVEALQNPEISMAEAGAAVERDAGLSAKLLQIANSAFFGLRQRVADVRTAVSSLGLELVRSLVCAAEPTPASTAIGPFAGYKLEAVDRLNALAARIARRLLDDRTAAQDAFCAARLRDVGALALMSALPDELTRILDRARTSGQSLWEVQVDVLGVTHAEIGAYLLGIWGLPTPIVDAVAHHRQPQRWQGTGLDAVSALHVAGALAEEVQPVDRSEYLGGGLTLDAGLLDKLDLHGRLPAWREIAREEARAA